MLQPLRMNSSASQSSSSGCVGLSPCKPKLLDERHDAAAEVVLPDAIDHDAGSQRIVWGGDPVGQDAASAACLCPGAALE